MDAENIDGLWYTYHKKFLVWSNISYYLFIYFIICLNYLQSDSSGVLAAFFSDDILVLKKVDALDVDFTGVEFSLEFSGLFEITWSEPGLLISVWQVLGELSSWRGLAMAAPTEIWKEVDDE